MVRSALGADPEADLLDNAELCTSELVTNAVVHAGTPVELSVTVHATGLRIEVQDHSAHLPIPRNYSSLAATGRGLMMIDRIVSRWGVRSGESSKTVWFELGESNGETWLEDPDASHGRATSPAALGTLSVELVNVPLLLHGAWQMHAQSLLREYLLLRLDEDSAMHEMETHAAASDAISLLEQFIRPPELVDEPGAIMASAIEPRVTASHLVMEVPGASVPHFEVLSDTMATAVALADRGVLLTPPTQPEVRHFRRWICAEVERQSRGLAPIPWDESSTMLEDVDLPAPLWDSATVDDAEGAVIAADDTGRILAVSPAAAHFLGYDSAADMAGRRLVEIVPERYRQAHLAGVTLHLFVGRAPLLGAPVVVPALRADGTEVPIQVLVTSHQLSSSRRVFLAHVEPAPLN